MYTIKKNQNNEINNKEYKSYVETDIHTEKCPQITTYFDMLPHQELWNFNNIEHVIIQG